MPRLKGLALLVCFLSGRSLLSFKNQSGLAEPCSRHVEASPRPKADGVPLHAEAGRRAGSASKERNRSERQASKKRSRERSLHSIASSLAWGLEETYRRCGMIEERSDLLLAVAFRARGRVATRIMSKESLANMRWQELESLSSAFKLRHRQISILDRRFGKRCARSDRPRRSSTRGPKRGAAAASAFLRTHHNVTRVPHTKCHTHERAGVAESRAH